MESFFQVKTPAEVYRIIGRSFVPVNKEIVPLEEAQGRVLAGKVVSAERLPDFYRSSMDGYAVRAKDTFGASESLPELLEVVGEVPMGKAPNIAVGQGQAVKVSTGAMLPEGADGVVMVEYCQLLDEGNVEVNRPLSPLENVIQPGDDLEAGTQVVGEGRRIRPQDCGVLAGLGEETVQVYRRPVVAVLSTGDEIVPIQAQPGPGQVRDINRYSLGALCQAAGAHPLYLGQCPDDFKLLKQLFQDGLNKADTLWVSGGSSVGMKDLTLRVFESLGDFELLVHGISISPGKPTIIGRCGKKPVIGLPGQVTSALVVAQVFLRPLLNRLSGQTDFIGSVIHSVDAKLAQNVESASGREDYIRVRLRQEEGGLIAEPLFGKSGLISTLVEADGVVRVDMNTEGVYRGQKVKVLCFDLW